MNNLRDECGQLGGMLNDPKLRGLYIDELKITHFDGLFDCKRERSHISGSLHPFCVDGNA